MSDMTSERDAGAPTTLAISTYDGSGQSVHPDYAAPGPRWGRGLSYFVVTPYPSGNNKYENPSLYASADNAAWSPAPGARTPLVTPSAGFLSDPDLVFDADRGKLYLYYRQAIDKREDWLQVMSSSDGVTWSEPSRVLFGGFTTLLSPSVVRRGAGSWMMWSVNASGACRGTSTSVELRTSANGATWAAPTKVTFPLPAGAYVWHVDVQWIPTRNEYWALFPIKTAGNCTTQHLMMATSRDGVTWKTADKPVLSAGAIPEFKLLVYRSSFSYDPVSDQISFWYSGARLDGKKRVWSLATQTRSRADVFAPAPGALSLFGANAMVDSTFIDPP